MATKPVHCPVCKAEQVDLANQDGELVVQTSRGWVVVTGFICAVCGRVTNWKVRRPLTNTAALERAGR